MKKGILAASSLGLLLTIGLPLPAAGADAKKGEATFNDNCAACHNSDSDELKVGPGLKNVFKRDKLANGKPVTDDNVKAIITDGSGGMPPFGDSISADDKDNLVAYLKSLSTAAMPAPAAAAAPAASTAPAAGGGDAKKGATVFNDNCAACHNSDSDETKVGPGLKNVFKRDKLANGKPVTDENVKGIITDGSGGMPPFGDSISADDKNNIIAYLKTL
jgi:cytochrome c